MPTSADGWLVKTGVDVCFQVDEETAGQLDKELTDGILEFVRFRDVTGSGVMWRADNVVGIFTTSEAIRERDRQLEKKLKAEDPFDE